MTIYSDLATKIKTAISHANVATIANVNATEWANYHVFDGGRSYIHGQNRGRVPFVNFYRNSSNYSFDAVGPDVGGQTDSVWVIEIIVAKSSASNEYTGESFAYSLSDKIIKQIRTDYNLGIGNEQINEIENHPFGISLKINLTVQNSYGHNDK